MIQTADAFAKQATDGDLALMQAFDEVIDLAWHRHTDPVNAFEQLQNPSSGGPPGRLVEVLRYGLVVACQLVASPALYYRIYPQGTCHDHQQPLDARGLLHKPRRDNAQRLFEEPKAPLGLGLTFVSLHDIGIAPRVCSNIGPYHSRRCMACSAPSARIRDHPGDPRERVRKACDQAQRVEGGRVVLSRLASATR